MVCLLVRFSMSITTVAFGRDGEWPRDQNAGLGLSRTGKHEK